MKYSARPLALTVAVVVAVLVIGGVLLSQEPRPIPGPTVTPPAAFPDANLRVDVVVAPPTSVVITSAILGCWIMDGPSTRELPIWWQSIGRSDSGWCGKEPINLPMATKADGRGSLWFTVSPPAHEAEIGHQYLESPFLSLNLSNGRSVRIEEPTLLAQDHWEILIPLDVGDAR